MKEKNKPILISIIVILLSFQTSCTMAPKTHADLNNRLNSLFQKELKSFQVLNALNDQENFIELSFDDVLQRAMNRNPEMNKLSCAYDKIQIDIKQNRSVVWPRIALQFSSAVPIGGDADSDDTIFSGGFNLNYNVMDAFFVKDAISINEVKMDQLFQHRARIIKQFYKDLTNLLSEIEFNQQQTKILYNSLNIAKQAVQRSSEMENSVRKFSRKIRTNKSLLNRLYEKLNHLTGNNYGSYIVIKDKEFYLAQPDKIDPPEPLSARLIHQVWNQRNDVDIEKKNLFLAEMNIVQAKRGRLPRFTASLSIGHIHFDSSDDNALLVPGVKISYPLFDIGDINRQIQKAQKNRDVAKVQLLSKIRTIVDELSEASLRLIIAIENLKHCKEELNRASSNAEKIKTLIDFKRADILEYYEAQLLENEKKMNYLKAIADFRKATATLKKIRGDALPESLASFTGNHSIHSSETIE